MRWPFQGKASPPESFPIGKYKLDGSVEGLGGLIEFSPSEYAAIGRQFVGEKDYNALPVSFLGRPWEVMVQAVHGRVCAIAPYLLADDKQDAQRIATETFRFCVEQLGKPAQQKPGFFLWNTTDGTVILRTEETDDELRIGLVLTSSCVSNLRRLSP
jgi:hypothetical protein